MKCIKIDCGRMLIVSWNVPFTLKENSVKMVHFDCKIFGCLTLYEKNEVISSFHLKKYGNFNTTLGVFFIYTRTLGQVMW